MRPDREPVQLANGLLKHAPPLPPLLRGRRRGWLALLVLLGFGQAALGALSAWALVKLQAAPTGASELLLRSLGVLVLSALAIGALVVHERVVSEKLGQDYVHQLRLTLLGDALTPGHATSLGVTVARTTNDLSGVRNWISQGIAPLTVAVPLIGGTLVTLTVLHPFLALAMAVPLVILGACLLVWARTALIKTRQMRRTRGRMASRIADTVTASDVILASGGTKRELKGIREASGKVVSIAVDRAETIGTIRAAWNRRRDPDHPAGRRQRNLPGSPTGRHDGRDGGGGHRLHPGAGDRADRRVPPDLPLRAHGAGSGAGRRRAAPRPRQGPSPDLGPGRRPRGCRRLRPLRTAGPHCRRRPGARTAR